MAARAAAPRERRALRRCRTPRRAIWPWVACGLLGAWASAGADEALRNWFNDPFFQVRGGIAECPVPLGPLTTESQMRAESHYRAERGTSCWLEKKCSKPNAYLYDAGIAAAVRERFAASTVLQDASLWITVQRRFVFVEGCVAAASLDGAVEALLRDLPDVERVLVNVTRDPRARPPYRTSALRLAEPHG